MIDHIYPSKIADTIADAVHAIQRLTDTQVNTCCEKQTITRMDFALECDMDTLDQVVMDLTEMGLSVAESRGTTSHAIYVGIDPTK